MAAPVPYNVMEAQLAAANVEIARLKGQLKMATALAKGGHDTSALALSSATVASRAMVDQALFENLGMDGNLPPSQRQVIVDATGLADREVTTCIRKFKEDNPRHNPAAPGHAGTGRRLPRRAAKKAIVKHLKRGVVRSSLGKAKMIKEHTKRAERAIYREARQGPGRVAAFSMNEARKHIVGSIILAQSDNNREAASVFVGDRETVRHDPCETPRRN